MATAGFEAYSFNPRAEAPKFVKGDPPASLPYQNPTEILSRLIEKRQLKKQTDASDEDAELLAQEVLLEGWMQHTSPKGEHYYREEKTGKVSKALPRSVVSGVTHDSLPTLVPGRASFSRDRTDSPTAGSPVRASVSPSRRGAASISDGQSGATGEPTPPENSGLLTPKPTETSRRGSTSRASSATRVESFEDSNVEDATDADAYASLSYVELYRNDAGDIELNTGILHNEDINTWLTTRPSERHPSIMLLMIPSVTNANELHVSQETSGEILQRFQLPAKMAMFSQVPQMMTYHFKIPVDEDTFVIHARSAISVSNASQLSYRYRQSDRSICGVLLDRTERSKLFIERLQSLQVLVGEWQLPLVALAQHAVGVSAQDAEKTESIYYFTKMLWSLISRRPSWEGGAFLDSIRDLQGIITTRKLHISAIEDLLRFLRKSCPDEESPFHPLLHAMVSVSHGQHLVAERHQQRHDSLIGASQYHVQTKIERGTCLATEANVKSLECTKSILEATNKTTIRTGSIMNKQHMLAQDAKKLQTEAGVNSRIMAILAVVTMLLLPAATVSEISNVFNWSVGMYTGMFVAATVLIFLITAGIWHWYPVNLIKRMSEPEDVENEFPEVADGLFQVVDADRTSDIEMVPTISSPQKMSFRLRNSDGSTLSAE